MLGKLIKYEMRSVMRIMAIVWIALPVATLLFGVGIKIYDNVQVPFELDLFRSIIAALSTMIYAGIFTALLVVTLVIIISRFYGGMLRDEGYLMHTLPVKVWQSITAKGVSAVVITLVSSLIAFLSIGILGMIAGGEFTSLRGLWQIAEIIQEYPQIIFTMFLAILTCVFSASAKIYMAYFSMALGQLSNKHKVISSVAFYLAIGAAVSVITIVGLTIFGIIFAPIIREIHIDTFEDGMLFVNLAVFGLAILGALQTAAFHFGTEILLRKKLNLE